MGLGAAESSAAFRMLCVRGMLCFAQASADLRGRSFAEAASEGKKKRKVDDIAEFTAALDMDSEDEYVKPDQRTTTTTMGFSEGKALDALQAHKKGCAAGQDVRRFR